MIHRSLLCHTRLLRWNFYCDLTFRQEPSSSEVWKWFQRSFCTLHDQTSHRTSPVLDFRSGKIRWEQPCSRSDPPMFSTFLRVPAQLEIASSGRMSATQCPGLTWSTVDSSHSDKKGRRSLVNERHSFRLFMPGFLVKIQAASSAFLAEISLSSASISHLTSKSFPLCTSTLWRPSGDVRFPLLFVAMCSLIRILSVLPVSPM